MIQRFPVIIEPLRESHEELRHRNVLALEEIGQTNGIFVCVHAVSFARDFSSSRNARGCDAARDLPSPLRGRPEGRSRTRTPAERCGSGLLMRCGRAKRARAETASSDPLGPLQRDRGGSLEDD
jgi:hypothetical protein